MADEFISPDVSVIADELAAISIADLSASTGWVAEQDSPLRHLLSSHALVMAFVASLVADAADGRIQFVGESFGRPQREAVSATVLGTVTRTGPTTAAVTIDEGDTWQFTSTGGETALVDVVDSVTIGIGSSSTSAGGVEFVFQNPGSAPNGLTGTLQPVIPIRTWFDTGTAASPVDGGADAEDGVTYRDKVARHLRSISPRPITAEDWESAGVDVDPAIYRLLVLENYNSTTSTTVGGHFTLVPARFDGTSVGVDAKNALQAIPKLSDVVLHIEDPTLTLVDVTATVVCKPEWVADHAGVAAAAESALRAWMDPSTWGSDATGDQSSWKPETKVRIKALEAVLTRADPVAYVSGSVNVTVQKQGVGSPQTTDLTLTGIGPLAKAGAVTITVVNP